jgi:DNA uptake protein ComE-like DNA-binding protein
MNAFCFIHGRVGVARSGQRGSTLVVVLWIAFGLVSLTLYFANSMSLELRAADQRVCGLQAEQAIEGAARYLGSMLLISQTNGVMPDPTTYLREAVAVAQRDDDDSAARFWLIGRDTNAVAPGQVSFALVDEASKLNLNTATSNMLIWLPRMTEEFAAAIVEWRDTNGGEGMFSLDYSMRQPGYLNKSAPFETVDELRLVYGGEMDVLAGEDLNRNGVLDPNETDENRNGVADPGLWEYVTVYSREPNTYSNGLERVDIRQIGSAGPFATLLQETLGSGRANEILTRLGVLGMGGGGPGGGRPGAGGGTVRQFNSPLQLYRESGMSLEEFAQIEGALTTTTNAYIEGRVNVNTASATVLACLPGLSEAPDLAQALVDYREMNPGQLTSIAWVVEAIGSNNNTVLEALAARDCITTRSYQFTADVAAVGAYGRGYRRTRFVFDTSSGTAQIVHRQDLTHLGWALGQETRKQWVAKATR